MQKLDERLTHLKSLTAAMGGCVEQMLKESGSITFNTDVEKPRLFSLILQREQEIDSLQVKLGKSCFRILARQRPVARDLRLILSIISTNTALERMGDLSLNIARKGKDLKEDPLLEISLDNLKEMFHEVTLMVKGCLDAFIHEDALLSRKIIKQDEYVDQLQAGTYIKLKECNSRQYKLDGYLYSAGKHLRKTGKNWGSGIQYSGRSDLFGNRQGCKAFKNIAMGNQKEILIVEDEADIRELMAFHLSKDNLFIDTASDGRIAYDKLLKNKYDLVIVDWMVPEISGLYLISWMKKPNHIQYKTPTLMVTAKSDPDNIIMGLETGADDYMVKPFDFDVLRARVQNLLKRGVFLESTKGKANDSDILVVGEFGFK